MLICACRISRNVLLNGIPPIQTSALTIRGDICLWPILPCHYDQHRPHHLLTQTPFITFTFSWTVSILGSGFRPSTYMGNGLLGPISLHLFIYLFDCFVYFNWIISSSLYLLFIVIFYQGIDFSSITFSSFRSNGISSVSQKKKKKKSQSRKAIN